MHYPVVGDISFKEGMLGEGVGSRVWKISHCFNLLLIKNPGLVAGQEVLELGSGVGSTGTRTTVIVFSKPNKLILGYFDHANIIFL